MKTSKNISGLQLLAASQWGLFSSAQAQDIGVRRQQLLRMVTDGRIEHLTFGMYRFTAGETTTFVDVKAAWMSVFPKETAFDRFKKEHPDAIATGRTAAYLNRVGDLYATPYTFIVQTRKQTTRDTIKYLEWEIDDEDITLIEGLPVASIERTIADLIRLKEEMSLVDDVISDAIRKGAAIDGNRLAKLLTPLAARNGFPRHNGEAFAHDVIKRNSDYREEIAKAIKPVRSLYANDKTIQVMSAGLLEFSKHLSDASDREQNIKDALDLLQSKLAHLSPKSSFSKERTTKEGVD